MNKHFFILMTIVLFSVLFLNCPGLDPDDADLFEGISMRDMVTMGGGTYNQQADNNGDGDISDANESFSHTITNFQMARYEITYELWYTVYQWAISHGYTFANAGREGNDGTDGAAPTAAKLEPVTSINWRDAIVWCNAYSSMYGIPVCYTYGGTVIKDSRDTNAAACDNAVCTWENSGYRLPTEGEWQFAASNKGETPHNYASGAIAPIDNAVETQKVAWYNVNSGLNTRVVGTTANPSALTLRDMSGNVTEWCWDWYGIFPGDQTDYRGLVSATKRILKGGDWTNDAFSLKIGNRFAVIPAGIELYRIGFRVARSLYW